MNNIPIKCNNAITCFGLYVDEELIWKIHIIHIWVYYSYIGLITHTLCTLSRPVVILNQLDHLDYLQIWEILLKSILIQSLNFKIVHYNVHL